ncbi:E3 ubiquitin-protein ligase MARCHF3-like [Amblyomma americanum]
MQRGDAAEPQQQEQPGRRMAEAAPQGTLPVYTCRFCLGSDNQMSMVTPCNCKGNFSHAHANCVAIQIYQNRVYACHICHYDFNIRWDNQKSFVDWLLDGDNLSDHVLFAMSVLFTLSLVLVLTFAWLQATQTLAHLSWLLAMPLALLLVLQSFTWMGFALYSLWLYRKAYLLWKIQSPPPALRQRLEAHAQ